MNISIISVNKANLMDIINDDSVYLIKQPYFSDRYQMTPIKGAEVGDLLSADVLIVKIIEE